MPVKINGATSGSVTLAAPATGSDVTLTLPAAAGTAATTAYADTAGGLQLITTQTFSAVSSVSINNCFTSTYDNYMIQARMIGSADQISLNFRLRSAGSDATGNNYAEQSLVAAGATVVGARDTVKSSSVIFQTGASYSGWEMACYGPQLADRTAYATKSAWNFEGSRFQDYVGSHSLQTAYDGFTMFLGSGTMTGKVRVYGYKNGA